MGRENAAAGLCCTTTVSSICFWTAVFLLADGAAVAVRAVWPTLRGFHTTPVLLALAIACFVNFARNRTYHCMWTGPLFLGGAIIAALTEGGVWAVSFKLLWGVVLIGVGAAFVAERRAGRPREGGER